jgi:twinkle protein
LGSERGIAVLDAYRQGAVITGDQIPWERYLKPEDKERVIPAEALAEKAKQEMLLGAAGDPGLELPWTKAKGRVFMRAGSLILWTGWSRHGKTRMLKQVMLHAIANGEKPLIASMEESVGTVFKDMARTACLTDDPSPRQIDRFVSFVRGKLWLYDQQGRVSPQKLIAVTRYAIAELKVTQVVIDSLMMMAIPRDDYEAQAAFVSELHNIVLHEPVTIHLVAHMRKREGKGGEEAPGSIHDVSGGQELGSMVDSVYIVWRNMKEVRQPAEFSAVLKIDKQRGRTDWLGTLGLNFHSGARQFVEDVHPMRFWDEDGQDF